MSEFEVTVAESATAKRASVRTSRGLESSAQLWKATVLSAGGVEVAWGGYGNVTIKEAKAFHAALGKAIEIAEGDQREWRGDGAET